MPEPQIKDARGWSPVDFGYLDNPKMLEVLDQSPVAALMHLASILYCAQHLTNGHITPGVARRKVGGSKDDEQTLIDVGMWHTEGHTCADCPQPEPRKVYVHDFLQHNRTAEAAKRRSEAAKRAAESRWAEQADADRNADRMPDALPIAMPSGANRNAEREKEREKDNSLAHRSASAPDRFPEWWAHWPRKIAKGAAAKAYKSALKKTDHDTLVTAVKAYAESERRKGTDPQYIPYPATWLNAERWEDDTTTTAQASKPEWMKYV